MLEKVDAGLRKIEYVMVLIAGFAAMFMMVMITLDVIMKRFFNSPLPGAYEITSSILMPLIVCPVFAFVYANNVLPKFTLLADKLNSVMRVITAVITAVVDILVFWLVFRYSINTTIRAFTEHTSVQSGTGKLMVYPVYLVLPIGFGILFLHVIVCHVMHLKGLSAGKETVSDS